MHDDAPLMYQTQLIKAHATGVGEPLDRDAVCATMLLRANAFAANYSGPSVAVVDRLLDFLNLGLHPVIPRKGLGRCVWRSRAARVSLTLEALRGELAAFEPPIHQARPHPGQRVTASNVLRFAGDSRRCTEEARQVVFPCKWTCWRSR